MKYVLICQPNSEFIYKNFPTNFSKTVMYEYALQVFYNVIKTNFTFMLPT